MNDIKVEVMNANELYNEMCRVVGDMVFTLHDSGIESKQMVIADALRTVLAYKNVERTELMVRAIECSVRTLDR